MKRKYLRKHAGRVAILAVLLLAVGLGAVMVYNQATVASPRAVVALSVGAECLAQQKIDPATVKGRDSCKECHADEYAAWYYSPHNKKAWDDLTGSKAKEFATALGISDPKGANTICVKCHGTPTESTVAIGVSCESCHGGSGGDGGWYAGHSDYGTDSKTMAELREDRKTETAEHKKARLAAADAAGMNRSDNPLAIARNCLQCHLMPIEALGGAGHPTGSKFEFVEWADGSVRHNFVLTPGRNYSMPGLWYVASAGRTVEDRKKLMTVAGMLADLEVSLRGRASVTSTKRKSIGDELNDRIEEAIEFIEDLEFDGLKPVLDAVADVDVKKLKDTTADDKAKYSAAADKVAVAAEAFIEAHKDGKGLPDMKVAKKAKGDVYKE